MSGWTSVRLIHWPRQQPQREWCRRHSVPRILIVEPGHNPPLVADIYEDWIRTPTSEKDLRVRAHTLATRRLDFERPTLENERELVVGGGRVGLSPNQVALVVPLIESYGDVVLRSTLARALGSVRQGDLSRNVLDLHVGRLRRKVVPLGLTISTAWGRGYALESAAPAVAASPEAAGLHIDVDRAVVS